MKLLKRSATPVSTDVFSKCAFYPEFIEVERWRIKLLSFATIFYFIRGYGEAAIPHPGCDGYSESNARQFQSKLKSGGEP